MWIAKDRSTDSAPLGCCRSNLADFEWAPVVAFVVVIAIRAVAEAEVFFGIDVESETLVESV